MIEPKNRVCAHRKLVRFAPLADTWKCSSCGALIPESAVSITEKATFAVAPALLPSGTQLPLF